jgi:hypothetical protein
MGRAANGGVVLASYFDAMINFTYTVHAIESGFLAKCCETGAEEEGESEDVALLTLRKTLVERLREPNAVAPPSSPGSIHVTLTKAPLHEQPDPQGPGEAC